MESLDPRDCPSFFTLVGGVGYLYTDTGELLRSYGQVIEPNAAAVPFQTSLSADGTEVIIGAGAGGGPRVVGLDLHTGEELFSIFVGDPAARSGVGVAFNPAASPVKAIADKALPGDVERIADILTILPPSVGALVGNGVVDVYSGNAITDLRQFANFKGVQTGTNGDGGRTYDDVQAIADYYGAYVRPDVQPGIVVHELGHVVEFRLPDVKEHEWVSIATHTTFPSVYENSNTTEAFAESFRRAVFGIDQPSAEVATYFSTLLGVR